MRIDRLYRIGSVLVIPSRILKRIAERFFRVVVSRNGAGNTWRKEQEGFSSWPPSPLLHKDETVISLTSLHPLVGAAVPLCARRFFPGSRPSSCPINLTRKQRERYNVCRAHLRASAVPLFFLLSAAAKVFFLVRERRANRALLMPVIDHSNRIGTDQIGSCRSTTSGWLCSGARCSDVFLELSNRYLSDFL